MNSQKYKWNSWNKIDWRTVECAVFKLQKRIYKASQRGDVKAVHKLQRLLTTSYYGRLWATRRVTQDNQGKKTAGVDGVKSLNSKHRLILADNLRLNGKSKPTRRVWIPKPNGEQRPLGIPTIEERAKQALAKLALEPQWECHFEDNSYGFRPAMSCHDAIEAIFNKHKASPQIALIRELNPIIRGWANYYRTVCSKEIFSYCDYILYQQLKRWAERRHSTKGRKWVKRKYWHSRGNRNWIFGVKKEGKIIFELIEHAKVDIVRHIKVQSGRSLYDGKAVYWSTRMGRHPEMPLTKATLLKRQNGKCNHCGLYFKDGDLIELDHIIPKSKGGKNEYKNFQLLHKHCHDSKTATDGSKRKHTYRRNPLRTTAINSRIPLQRQD